MSVRIIKIVAVMALVVAMAGCASSGSRERSVRSATVERGAGEQGTATVRTGMTMSEVEGLWGKPEATRTEDGNPDVETWTYERHEAAAAHMAEAYARIRGEPAVVIGGNISSTLLTLILVPVIYNFFDALAGLFRRPSRQPAAASPASRPQAGADAA